MILTSCSWPVLIWGIVFVSWLLMDSIKTGQELKARRKERGY